MVLHTLVNVKWNVFCVFFFCVLHRFHLSTTVVASSHTFGGLIPRAGWPHNQQKIKVGPIQIARNDFTNIFRLFYGTQELGGPSFYVVNSPQDTWDGSHQLTNKAHQTSAIHTWQYILLLNTTVGHKQHTAKQCNHVSSPTHDQLCASISMDAWMAQMMVQTPQYIHASSSACSPYFKAPHHSSSK